MQCLDTLAKGKAKRWFQSPGTFLQDKSLQWHWKWCQATWQKVKKMVPIQYFLKDVHFASFLEHWRALDRGGYDQTIAHEGWQVSGFDTFSAMIINSLLPSQRKQRQSRQRRGRSSRCSGRGSGWKILREAYCHLRGRSNQVLSAVDLLHHLLPRGEGEVQTPPPFPWGTQILLMIFFLSSSLHPGKISVHFMADFSKKKL